VWVVFLGGGGGFFCLWVVWLWFFFGEGSGEGFYLVEPKRTPLEKKAESFISLKKTPGVRLTAQMKP